MRIQAGLLALHHWVPLDSLPGTKHNKREEAVRRFLFFAGMPPQAMRIQAGLLALHHWVPLDSLPGTNHNKRGEAVRVASNMTVSSVLNIG